MIATIINTIAILVGSMAGLVFKKRLREEIRTVVFVAAGILSLIIGIMMAMRGERMLYLAVSLVAGGLIGAALNIEAAILRFGGWLRSLASPRPRRARKSGSAVDAAEASSNASAEPNPELEKKQFARGFLEASVLFCVGAMAILGSIQAGVANDYTLLLTKSIMDGFISVLLAATLGSGVAASALSVLVYQGGLTLLASLLQGTVPPLVLTMISSVGGGMVIMIGINLLGLRSIPTANFLPSIVLALVFALIDPYLPTFLRS